MYELWSMMHTGRTRRVIVNCYYVKHWLLENVEYVFKKNNQYFVSVTLLLVYY